MVKSERSIIIGVAATLVIIAAATVLLTYRETDEPIEAEKDVVLNQAQPEEDPPNPVSSQDTHQDSDELPGDADVGMRIKEDIESTSIVLSGEVVDLKSGAPVREYAFKLQRFDTDKWNDLVSETISNTLGEFHFVLDAGGKHRIYVKARRYVPCSRYEIDIPIEKGLSDLTIKLDPGIKLQGKVVDHVSCTPVEGALVGPVSYDAQIHFKRILTGKESDWNHEVTDECGLFDLNALTGNFKDIVAIHPDYAEGSATLDFSNVREVEIRMKSGAHIFGSAFDDEGELTSEVFITQSGRSNLMPRTVITSPDGSFKLPPANPGTVDVAAESSSFVKATALKFTAETKSVELAERDVEIYFGPSQDHVTWRGKLYDCEGKPLPGAGLMVTPVRPVFYIYQEDKTSRNALCDETGEFEIRKLQPGNYAVQLRLSGQRFRIDWDTVAFDLPGIVERDIRILGGVIKGTVVDAGTGDPLVGIGGYIFGRPLGGDFRSFSANIDDDARFVLQGLPPANYKLDARVKGFPPAGMELTVKKNERIENLRLPVAPGGAWILRFKNFEKADPRECEVNWSRDGGRGWHSRFRVDESGDEVTFMLETGKWILDATFEGWGTVEKEFFIHAGKTSEVIIDRSDVAPKAGTLNAQVKLSWADGSPAGGVTVQFFAMAETRKKTEETYIYGTTDPAGRIDLTGFIPGQWSFKAQLPDGGEAELPELDIVDGSPSPYSIDVVIPAGEITGVFHDSVSGKPFGEAEPMWWIHLFDAVAHDYITSIQAGKGSRFRVFGVNSSKYKLKLKARGYKDQDTHLFNLSDGQSLDLGRIDMEPLGTLDLEVVDSSGNPIRYYEIRCPGRQVQLASWSSAPGRMFESGFPMGRCTITISAKGYRQKEIDVHFEPGITQSMQIVLEKE